VLVVPVHDSFRRVCGELSMNRKAPNRKAPFWVRADRDALYKALRWRKRLRYAEAGMSLVVPAEGLRKVRGGICCRTLRSHFGARDGKGIGLHLQMTVRRMFRAGSAAVDSVGRGEPVCSSFIFITEKVGGPRRAAKKCGRPRAAGFDRPNHRGWRSRYSLGSASGHGDRRDSRGFGDVFPRRRPGWSLSAHEWPLCAVDGRRREDGMKRFVAS
jgi:hypothetical protein